MNYDTDPAAQIKILKALERAEMPDTAALKKAEKSGDWPKPTAAEKKAEKRAAMIERQIAYRSFVQGGASRGEIIRAVIWAILALLFIFLPEVFR